ncbi:hypothetical protein [Microbacterium sp. F2]|uniref:hypothetical protein n=1 Tax=Microbacterium sp. F2 TaxID=3422228 RepID=UPI003FD1459C
MMDAVAALGVPMAVAYFTASGATKGTIRRFAYIGVSVFAPLAYIGLVFYSTPVSDGLSIGRIALSAVWIAIIPGALIAVRRAEWNGNRVWKMLDLERVLGPLFRLLAIVALWWLGSTSAVAFAALPLIAGMLASSILFFPIRAASVNRTRPLRASEFYRYALISAGAGIAASSGARLNQAIMPSVSTSTELGLYAVSTTIAEVPLIIGLVAARNLLPAAANPDTRRHIRANVFEFSGLGLLGSLLLALIVPWVTPLVFGSAFSASAPTTIVLLAGTVFSVFILASSAVIAGLGSPGLSGVPQFIIAGLTLVTMLTLPHPLTAIEVAVISTASQAVASIISAFLLIRKLRQAPDPGSSI